MKIGRGIRYCLCAALVFCAAGEASGQSPTNAPQYIVENVSTLETGAFGNATTGAVVTLQGYDSIGDGGGGVLVSAPTSSTYPQGSCMTGAGYVDSSAPNTIEMEGPIPIGLTINMTVSGTGVAPGTTIADYSVNSGTITLSQTATPSGKIPYAFGLSSNTQNEGMFLDVNKFCFTRANPTYSQKEYGARSDGQQNDDTLALQNWLNANQPHIAVAGNSYIFGPLYCGGQDSNQNPATDGAIIQGAPTQAGGQPTFWITADNNQGGFDSSGEPYKAMLVMPAKENCAIHAVGLFADKTVVNTPYNVINAFGGEDLIDQHSVLSGGYNNLYVPTGGNPDLQVYDSQISNSVSDNINLTTNNAKIIRNVINSAGGNNLTVSGSEFAIADNNIWNAAGWGLSVQSAHLVRVNGNYFDNNGMATAGTGAIEIKNSGTVPICGNTFHRTGAATEGNPALTSAHIVFDGSTDDSVSLCGNTYFAGLDTTGANPLIAVRPDYDYDAAAGTILTNISIADNAAPQNQGVLSPEAQTLIGSPVNAQVAKNYLTGLTLSNDPNTATPWVVDIAAGQAADSTGSAIINLPQGCNVDLTKSGAGGLDTGAASWAHSTTYFIFAISGYGGANPNCMVSASLTPSFLIAGAPYAITQTADTTANSTVVFNAGGPTHGITKPTINPLAGMAQGDVVTGSDIKENSKIQSLTSYYQPLVTGNWMSSDPTLIYNISSLPTGVAVNMSVGQTVSTSADVATATAPTWISDICTPTACLSSQSPPPLCTAGSCLVLNDSLTCGSTCSTAGVVVSGNYTMTLNKPVNNPASAPGEALTIYNGYYRLLGALYTTSNSTTPTFVSFTQNNDTFYLQQPVADVPGLAVVPSQTTVILASVPKGISVKAFGRCVGGSSVGTHHVILYSPGQSGTPPAENFPTPPGFDVDSLSPGTAFPFSAWTDTEQSLLARTDASGVEGVTLQCMTDGWNLNRTP